MWSSFSPSCNREKAFIFYGNKTVKQFCSLCQTVISKTLKTHLIYVWTDLVHLDLIYVGIKWTWEYQNRLKRREMHRNWLLAKKDLNWSLKKFFFQSKYKKTFGSLRTNYMLNTCKILASKFSVFWSFQICYQRGECFDMKSRRDPTVIGTDEFGNAVLGYYTCTDGYCIEIYDLTCERRCNELTFQMTERNSIIVSGERLIIAECSARATAAVTR